MHIHFIGIGGISMSALAQICLNKGYKISGSDMQESEITNKLRKNGAKVYIGHKKENITEDINLVVYTAAIKEDNEELIETKIKHIHTLDRASFLGQLMKEYKNAVAISGTHGKTSTTSMVSLLFEYAHLDPTILVGGNLKDIGGNIKIGHSENFITEACEYVDSFLKFYPKTAVVLNIEADHLDYFSGLEDIQKSFNTFGKLIPEDGYFIVNGDDENVLPVLEDIKGKIIKYGKNEKNDVIISNTSFDALGHGMFSLSFKERDLGSFKLSIPGMHNIYNATAAILTALVSHIDLEEIRSNITKYTGVGRRFEYKGTYKEATIIDDYAHHPTEIKATLSAAKNICKETLWCVFQPHTYTRTKSLLNEFSTSFSDADKVIITDIYAAREKNTGEIHALDLVQKIKSLGKEVIYIKELEEISTFLCDHLQRGDFLITAGAGNVYAVGEKILEKN